MLNGDLYKNIINNILETKIEQIKKRKEQNNFYHSK